MLIVGILAIPKVYYEAVAVDGANAWQRFRFITLPMLRQTLAVTVVLNVIYGLKVFDMVYALTNGGPGHRTEVMYTAVFKMMSKGLYAEGTTISSIMFIFMAVIGYFMVKILTNSGVKNICIPIRIVLMACWRISDSVLRMGNWLEKTPICMMPPEG